MGLRRLQCRGTQRIGEAMLEETSGSRAQPSQLLSARLEEVFLPGRNNERGGPLFGAFGTTSHPYLSFSDTSCSFFMYSLFVPGRWSSYTPL